MNEQRVQKVYRQGSLSVGTASNATVISYTIPSGTKFMLTDFANYVTDFGAWGNLIWRIRFNGINVFPLNAISDQMGDQSNLIPVGDEIIGLGGDVFSVFVENSSTTTAYIAGAIIRGVVLSDKVFVSEPASDQERFENEDI